MDSPQFAFSLRRTRRAASPLLSAALVGSVLLLFPFSCQAEILMRVSAGFGGKCKDNCWTPVSITLRNTGEDVAGRVEVSLLSLSRELTSSYSKKLALPKSSRKRTFLYIHPSSLDYRLIARYVSRRKTLAEDTADINPISGEDELHVVVGSGPTGLESLASRRKDDVPKLHVVRALPTELPDRWIGYAGVDSLIFTSPFVEGLGHETQRAIGAWIAGGGRVAISTGRRGAFLKGSFWERLLPIAVSGSTELATFNGLPAFIGQERRENVAPYVVTIGEMTDGEQLAAEDGAPLVIQGHFGKGGVTFLAFSLDSPPFEEWDGKSEFWDKLLNESLYPASLRDERRWERGRKTRSFDEPPTSSDEIVARGIQPKRAKEIKLWWAFWLILLYVAAIGPIDYLVMKKTRRPKLTWLTFSVSVVGFSVVAYCMARYARSGDMELKATTFLDVPASRSTLKLIHGRTYFSIYSPQNARYEVSLDKTDAFTSPLQASPRFRVAPGGGLTFEAHQRSSVNAILTAIPIWSAKTFRADWCERIDAVAPRIDADILYADDRLQGSISNRLGFDLASFRVFAGDTVYSFGPMRDGETRDIVKYCSKAETFERWAERMGPATQTGGGRKAFSLGMLSLRARMDTARRRKTSFDRCLDLSAQSERGAVIFVGKGSAGVSDIVIKGWRPRPTERVIVRCILSGGDQK